MARKKMGERRIRFAMAGIIHETNTFATEYAGVTPLSAFERYAGEEIIAAFAGANHPVAGFIDGASKHGAEIIPAFLAQATPAGTIDALAYAEMKRAVLAGIESSLPVDGVLLALHGAGVADGIEDVDGDLAAAVRDLVGRDVPIAAAYDLHGNMTLAMQTACDISLPCRLYPHVDLHQRAMQCVDLLIAMREGLRPTTFVRQLPMLGYIVPTLQGSAPAEANDLCCKLGGSPGILDLSWFHGFPLSDVAGPCPSVICTTDNDLDLARRTADQLAAWIWENRERFRPSLPTPAEGIALGLAARRGPIVVGDYADNPGGGAPGDGTQVLRALLEARPAAGTCCFASINDPQTVALAQRAGVGATVRVSLGAKFGRYQGQPIQAEAYVKGLTDGRFVNRPGSMFEGVRFDVGPTCRLIVEGVDVVVASRAEQIYDAEPFASHGIDVTQRKIVALKGANHFRAGFQGISADIITVDGGGLSSSDLARFERLRLAAPVWPLDDVYWTTQSDSYVAPGP